MADVIRYDPASTPPGRVTAYMTSVATELVEGQANTLINPDVSAVLPFPVREWRVDGGVLVHMTQPEIDSINAQDAASELQRRKDAVAALRDDPGMVILVRAQMTIIVQQLNVIRARLVPPMADLTLNQAMSALQTAIQTEINNIS